MAKIYLFINQLLRNNIQKVKMYIFLAIKIKINPDTYSIIHDSIFTTTHINNNSRQKSTKYTTKISIKCPTCPYI